MCNDGEDCNIWDQMKRKCFKIKANVSLNSIIGYLYLPRDAASLGVIRFFYGLLMVCDVFEERGGSYLDIRWDNRTFCNFPLFPILKPFDFKYMALVYTIMWIGAWGIMLGYKFKCSCVMFTITYWYVLLLDKTVWNNHSYLYGVLAILLSGSCANRWFSVDAYFAKEKMEKTVPNWNYMILKFQVFILYFYAGLKKTDTEWLDGYGLNLGNHWVFEPFKILLTTEQIDLLVVHWFGFLLDLTIGFWLLWGTTRPYALFFCSSFHLMNSRIFRIGMFPYMGLATLPIFCDCDWPRNLCDNFKNLLNRLLKRSAIAGGKNKAKDADGSNPTKEAVNINITAKQKLVFGLLLTHCFLQITLPYSHFITKGYNNWTNGLYGYSWDMMVHSWNTVLVVVKVVDNRTGRENFMNTSAWVENERWSKQGDMLVQYAQCLKHNLIQEYEGAKSEDRSDIKSFITSPDISVYVDVWCSLNGRFQQRMFDPRYDLLKANWSPFGRVEWLLPLLTEFNEFREKLSAIEKEVHSWSNSSDVLFVADFPGLFLENYISNDKTNVTLTVIDGTITFESDMNDEVHRLTAGESIKVPTEMFHKVTTISSVASCFMYTYANEIDDDDEVSTSVGNKSYSPIPVIENTSEFYHKLNLFLMNIANGLSRFVYETPPTSVRKT